MNKVNGHKWKNSSILGIKDYSNRLNSVDLNRDDYDIYCVRLGNSPSVDMKHWLNGTRNIFSVTEGDWVNILFTSYMDFEKLQMIWDSCHRIELVAQDGTCMEGKSAQLYKTHKDHNYKISVQVDFSSLSPNKTHGIWVHTYLGNFQIPFIDKGFMLVTNINPIQVAVRQYFFSFDDDMQKADRICQAIPVKSVPDYRFVETNAWFSCFNSFSHLGLEEDEIECEIRYYDKENNLVDIGVVRPMKGEGGTALNFKHNPFVQFWAQGEYTVKVYMFGKCIAIENILLGNKDDGSGPVRDVEIQNKDAWKSLEEMVGLAEVKKTVRKNMNYMKMLDCRHKLGLPASERMMHMVFTGNPGTGKTTVARLMGELLKGMGVLSKGHLVECNRECLIDNIVGGTEKKTAQYIDKAKGGVLFIDEAYSLMDVQASNDFGKRVLDTLMPVLTEKDSDMVVILAGYKKEMELLLNTNPGLASRFPLRMNFPDYNVSELFQMISDYLNRYRYKLKKGAEKRLFKIVERVSTLHNFGAGRFINNLLQNIILPNMANRLAEKIDNGLVNADLLTAIYPEDVPEPEEVMALMGLTDITLNKLKYAVV